MYLTPYQKKQLRTVIILIVGIPLTIFAAYKAVMWFTGASGDVEPQNIIIGNLSQSSVTVTWTTESKVVGSAVLIENEIETETGIDKRGDGKRNTHYVEFEYLEPGTTYEFKIISGSDTYSGKDDENFSFSTPNVLAEQPSPIVASGEVEGNWGDDVLVYIAPKDKSAYPAITILNSSGTWLSDLSVMRNVSDKTLYEVSSSDTLVILGVSGVDDGGLVEGEYGEIFNSNSILVESLNPTGIEYEPYISNEARLVAEESTEEPYIPLAIGGGSGEEEEIEREYELRSDLVWTDLASGDGRVLDSPESYGESTVRITNLTDTTFTVIWYSQNKETGYVMYGTSSTAVSERGRDERDGIASQGQYYLHSIEITQLEPETQYYFKVYSGEEIYDDTYEVTTFITQSTPPEFETISGSVDVQYPESALVVAVFRDDDGVGSAGESYPISTIVDSDGYWILTTGSVRDEDEDYFEKSNYDLVTFDPLYLSQAEEFTTTVGEATTGEVDLLVSEGSGTKFVKIDLLEDYRVLID